MKKTLKEMGLEDRLKASLKKMQGSLVPEERIAPPPEKEAVQEIQEIITDSRVRLKLLRLTEQYSELQRQESEAKKLKEPLSKQIKAILGEHEISKAQMGEYRFNYFTSSRTSLDEIKLMQNGVSPAVIAKSKTSKEVYTLKVSRKGEPEDE